MIRVNLLNNLIAAESTQVATERFAAFGGDRAVLVKLGVIFWAIPLLIVAQIVMKQLKQRDLDSLQRQASEIEMKITQLGPAVSEVEKFVKEKEQLNKKFEVIAHLAANRLAYVRALDTLQTLLPEKAWFTSLDFDGNRLTIKGDASEDSIILEFVRKLEENIHFGDVALTSAVEVKAATGVLKRFELVCVLESK